MTDLIATREAGLNDFITASRPMFEAAGAPLPENIRASIGWPLGVRPGNMNIIAQIVHHSVSADGHYEIFISPVNKDIVAICAALTHELIHAATGFPHDKAFGRACKALGLNAPLTHTTPNDDWFSWAQPIMEGIKMDYAAIDFETPAAPADPANPDAPAPLPVIRINRRVKGTPGKKTECPECGWLARVSAKHILPFPYLNCPVPDCSGILITSL